MSLDITKQVKDLYSKGDIVQIIHNNKIYFKMCLLLQMNLGEAIKKLIDKGVKYPEIILSIHEALDEFPNNELTKKDLEALGILNKLVNN